MKIISQYYKIIRIDSMELIESAARTCYQSNGKGHWCAVGGCAEEAPPCSICRNHAAYGFVKRLIKCGHLAMLEHASMSVRFVTDRAVTHELVRHRLASYAQESQRFVKYDGDMEFIRPVWVFEGDHRLDDYLSSVEKMYKDLLGQGWLPEQARMVLPNCTKTEIVVTANFREWRHIFELRALGTTGRPHPQMEALMRSLLAEAAIAIPAVFEDLEERMKEKE